MLYTICFEDWGFLSIVVDVLVILQSSVYREIIKLYPLIFSQRCNEDRYALYDIQHASCLARTSRTNYPKSILVENPFTAEPRFNEPLYNEVLGLTNDFLQPGQNCSNIYGIEPIFLIMSAFLASICYR